VLGFEVLTTVWPENSTYYSASNCTFSFCLFVCLFAVFNNVVSNSGHVKHKRISTKPADDVRHCSKPASCVWTQTYEPCLIWAGPACPHGSPSMCSEIPCLPCVRFIVWSILYADVILPLVDIRRGDVSVVFSVFNPTGRIAICTSLGYVGWDVTAVTFSVCLNPATSQRFVNRTVGEIEGDNGVPAMAVWVITLYCSEVGCHCRRTVQYKSEE